MKKNETLMSERDTKDEENVIARSVSDEAISKGKIATPSARNDKLGVFSGEIRRKNNSKGQT